MQQQLSHYKIAVFGDLNLELCACLSKKRFRDVSGDYLAYESLTKCPGGTGFNFADAAASLGHQVFVFGSIGNDFFADWIENELSARGVLSCCERVPERNTGTAIILRDGSHSPKSGVRMLIVETDSANHQLSEPHVQRHRDKLISCDALVVDGYSLLRQPRRNSILCALDIASGAGVKIVFDLVPHDAEQFFSVNELKPILKLADVLIVEARTVRRLFRLGEQSDEIQSRGEALHAMQTGFDEFGVPSIEIRFGLGNISEVLFGTIGGSIHYSRTNYLQVSEKRGFGDKLTASNLSRYIRD